MQINTKNLIIIILILGAFYFFRNPIENLWQRGVNSILGEKTEENANPESGAPSEAISLNKKEEVVAPGPLTILSNIEIKNSASEALTVSGIIKETNAERVKKDIKPLKESKLLDASALKKVNDMFAKQYFEHVSPNGVGVADLGKSVGYEYITIGENLALGNFKNDADVVAAWMASPGHRANILRPGYQEIGVAAKKGMYKGRSVWIAVQHFGTPLTACPQVDKSLKAGIESNKNIIEPIEDRVQILKTEIESRDYKGQEYNDRVDEYNSLVAQYNELVAVIKKQIAQYNAQVEAFNSCARVG